MTQSKCQLANETFILLINPTLLFNNFFHQLHEMGGFLRFGKLFGLLFGFFLLAVFEERNSPHGLIEHPPKGL